MTPPFARPQPTCPEKSCQNVTLLVDFRKRASTPTADATSPVWSPSFCTPDQQQIWQEMVTDADPYIQDRTAFALRFSRYVEINARSNPALTGLFIQSGLSGLCLFDNHGKTIECEALETLAPLWIHGDELARQVNYKIQTQRAACKRERVTRTLEA